MKENPNPGPGQYDAKSMMNGSGSLFCSKYRSCTAKTMGAKTKISIGGAGKSKLYENNKIAPGPGSYLAFSEFGIYESQHAKELDKSQHAKELDKTK